MKPFFLFSLGLALLLIGHTTRAQIVRVTNGQSLSALIASATAGTTFIVEPGSYGDLTLTKRVAIIGPGYFLGSSQQATIGSATFGTINFKAGSEGSVLMSCVVNNSVSIEASSVIVAKCNVGGVTIGASQVQVSGMIVKQNFIRGGISVLDKSVNFSIKSNIIGSTCNLGGLYSGEFINNTSLIGYCCIRAVDESSAFSGAILLKKNNILYNLSNSYGASFNFFHISIPFSTIFILTNSNSLDGQYMLLANSPAKGAGEGGVDCGAFGGDEPYVIGGVPSGPIIQELTVPQVTSGNTINVRVKARVQN